MVCGPRSLPWSLVPCPFLGDTPLLSLVLSKILSYFLPEGGDTAVLSLVLPRGEGCPNSEQGHTASPSPARTGGISPPGQDRGTLPHTAQNHDGCATRAVCFLRSRRRTFLFNTHRSFLACSNSLRERALFTLPQKKLSWNII